MYTTVLAATVSDGFGLSWDGIGTIFTIVASALTLFWRISTWKATQDERLKQIEALVVGDGKGNEGCALRHRALDAKLADAASRKSMADAFDQIRAIEERAAEDRRKTDVALTEIKGILQALVEKVDRLMMTDDDRRPLGRTKTDPGIKR